MNEGLFDSFYEEYLVITRIMIIFALYNVCSQRVCPPVSRSPGFAVNPSSTTIFIILTVLVQRYKNN